MAQDFSLFELIPSEILLLILSYLPRAEVEQNCAAVCRSWRCTILSRVPLQVPAELLSSDASAQAALLKCLGWAWNRGRPLRARVLQHHLEALADPSPLAAGRLVSLDLSHTRFFQTPLLAMCTSLQTLDLSCTAVRDIAPLAALAPSLAGLNLAGTKVENVGAVLPRMRKLRYLDLSRTPATDADVEAINELPLLEELDLSHTRITTVPYCLSLRVLNVASTAVTSLEPLVVCPDLRRLDISHTRVSRVWPLLWCRTLEHLRSLDTEASDLALMLQHNALRTVLLPHTPVSDMYTLKNCPFLLYCNLHGSIRVL